MSESIPGIRLSDEVDERGGVFVERPECLSDARGFTFRSRWTTNVHNGDHVTVHVSVNPELDADEVSFAPFGGDTRTYRIESGTEHIPADADDPSPEIVAPIKVEPEGEGA